MPLFSAGILLIAAIAHCRRQYRVTTHQYAVIISARHMALPAAQHRYHGLASHNNPFGSTPGVRAFRRGYAARDSAISAVLPLIRGRLAFRQMIYLAPTIRPAGRRIRFLPSMMNAYDANRQPCESCAIRLSHRRRQAAADASMSRQKLGRAIDSMRHRRRASQCRAEMLEKTSSLNWYGIIISATASRSLSK